MFPDFPTKVPLKRDLQTLYKPEIIGYLSVDESRNISIDISQLRFIREVENNSNVHFDLKKDASKAKVADQQARTNKRLTHLLKFILLEETRLHSTLHVSKVELERAMFICRRSLLTLLANVPYESRDGGRIMATLHKGNIFLCALDTEQNELKLWNMPTQQLDSSTWGHKFEQYLLSDAPDQLPDTSKPVKEDEGFSVVLTANLGGHKLFLTAEVDGLLCQPDEFPPADTQQVNEVIQYLSDKKFIELKTSKHVEHPNQERSMRQHKMKKWWSQSFFSGGETVLIGYRDDNGIVSKLSVLKLEQLLKTCRAYWDPDVCLSYVDNFLSHVKKCLASEISRKYGESRLRDLSTIPTTSLHFTWNPRQKVRVTEYNPESDAILTDWFLNDFGKH